MIRRSFNLAHARVGAIDGTMDTGATKVNTPLSGGPPYAMGACLQHDFLRPDSMASKILLFGGALFGGWLAIVGKAYAIGALTTIASIGGSKLLDDALDTCSTTGKI